MASLTHKSLGQLPRLNHKRIDITPFPYESFATKSDFTTDEGGPWSCARQDEFRCFMVAYHISAVSTPLLAMGGSPYALISYPGNGGSTIAYTWGFQACHTTVESDGLLQTAVGANQYTDTLPSCPTLSAPIMHSGTITLDSSSAFYLRIQALWGGDNFEGTAVYMGDFTLQLNVPDRPPLDTTTTSPSTSTSAGTSTLSSPSITLSGISSGAATYSNNVSIPSASGSTATVSTILDGIITSNTSTSSLENGPSIGQFDPPAGFQRKSSLGPAIGGAIGGVVLITLLVVCLFCLRRRRQGSNLDKQLDPLVIGETWHAERHVPTGNEKAGALAALVTAAGLSPELNVTSSQTYGSEKSFHRPVSGMSTELPSTTGNVPETMVPSHSHPEDLHERHRTPPLIHPLSPSMGSDIPSPPTYEAHYQAPLVTLRSPAHPTPYTFLDSSYQVHDVLGEWAEAHRDIVSVDLERRLRVSGWAPGEDLEAMSVNMWMERYGVSVFELRRLKGILQDGGEGIGT